MTAPFDTLKNRMLRVLYHALWTLALPLVPFYLQRRARKDPDYRLHWSERFGGGTKLDAGSIWIHAVSLGEVRSAVPLARTLLDQGDRLCFTNGTPAGRRAVEDEFRSEISAGTVDVRYLPVEQHWAFRKFFARVRPRLGLVMEVEFWPVMIAAARRGNVPLYLCNGQYPGRSFDTDPAWRKAIPSGFAAVMVKSQMMVDRFRSVGCKQIAITGELRFEQPIPPLLTTAGDLLRGKTIRPIIVFSSVVEGEDEVFLQAIQATKGALFIYVPRAKERFDPVFEMLTDAGLRVARRSEVFGDHLSTTRDLDEFDVILGDSYGEMYAWLAMADQVVIGGGFTAKASHNIIEALAVGKPVAVGPNIQTIEYPGVEAIAAGVCTHLQTGEDLTILCRSVYRTEGQNPLIEDFLSNHSGAVRKTLNAIDGFTNR